MGASNGPNLQVMGVLQGTAPPMNGVKQLLPPAMGVSVGKAPPAMGASRQLLKHDFGGEGLNLRIFAL